METGNQRISFVIDDSDEIDDLSQVVESLKRDVGVVVEAEEDYEGIRVTPTDVDVALGEFVRRLMGYHRIVNASQFLDLMKERGPQVKECMCDEAGGHPIRKIDGDRIELDDGIWIERRALIPALDKIAGFAWVLSSPHGLHFDDEAVEGFYHKELKKWDVKMDEMNHRGPREGEKFVCEGAMSSDDDVYWFKAAEFASPTEGYVILSNDRSLSDYVIKLSDIYAGNVSSSDSLGSVQKGWIIKQGVGPEMVRKSLLVKKKDLPEDSVLEESLGVIREELGIDLNVDVGEDHSVSVKTDVNYISVARFQRAVMYLIDGKMTADLPEEWSRVFWERGGDDALWLLRVKLGCEVDLYSALGGFEVRAPVPLKELEQALEEIDPSDCIPPRPEVMDENAVFILGGVPDYVPVLLNSSHEGVHSKKVEGGIWISAPGVDQDTLRGVIMEKWDIDGRKFG